jgi:hydrogenase nickel incorporation protein HypA/HybF
MHEYPVTEEIVRIAVERAVQAGAKRITDVRIRVGELSGFIGESIQMYFDVLSEGTLAQGARVHIIPVKPILKCRSCGHVFPRAPRSFDCPQCGGLGDPTPVGRELQIENIEIEE